MLWGFGILNKLAIEEFGIVVHGRFWVSLEQILGRKISIFWTTIAKNFYLKSRGWGSSNGEIGFPPTPEIFWKRVGVGWRLTTLANWFGGWAGGVGIGFEISIPLESTHYFEPIHIRGIQYNSLSLSTPCTCSVWFDQEQQGVNQILQMVGWTFARHTRSTVFKGFACIALRTACRYARCYHRVAFVVTTLLAVEPGAGFV